MMDWDWTWGKPDERFAYVTLDALLQVGGSAPSVCDTSKTYTARNPISTGWVLLGFVLAGFGVFLLAAADHRGRMRRPFITLRPSWFQQIETRYSRGCRHLRGDLEDVAEAVVVELAIAER